MENTFFWILLTVAAAVLGGAAVYILVKRLDGEGDDQAFVEDLLRILALAREKLGDVFSEGEVRAMARYVWRVWRLANDYYSEEEWIALWLRVLLPSEQMAALDGGVGPLTANEVRGMEHIIEALRTAPTE